MFYIVSTIHLNSPILIIAVQYVPCGIHWKVLEEKIRLIKACHLSFPMVQPSMVIDTAQVGVRKRSLLGWAR
jgi:hypothetical protein